MPFDSIPPGPPNRDTADADDDAQSPDDNQVLYYGHAATGPQRHEIETLVRRYYSAGAAGDGTMLCSLLYDLIAESLMEEYASQPALAGPTCGSVASKLLAQRHVEMVVDAATLEITWMRVNRQKAYAAVFFGRRPEPYLVLHRQGNAWKVQSLFAGGLP